MTERRIDFRLFRPADKTSNECRLWPSTFSLVFPCVLISSQFVLVRSCSFLRLGIGNTLNPQLPWCNGTLKVSLLPSFALNLPAFWGNWKWRPGYSLGLNEISTKVCLCFKLKNSHFICTIFEKKLDNFSD